MNEIVFFGVKLIGMQYIDYSKGNVFFTKFFFFLISLVFGNWVEFNDRFMKLMMKTWIVDTNPTDR